MTAGLCKPWFFGKHQHFIWKLPFANSQGCRINSAKSSGLSYWISQAWMCLSACEFCFAILLSGKPGIDDDCQRPSRSTSNLSAWCAIAAICMTWKSSAKQSVHGFSLMCKSACSWCAWCGLQHSNAAKWNWSSAIEFRGLTGMVCLHGDCVQDCSSSHCHSVKSWQDHQIHTHSEDSKCDNRSSSRSVWGVKWRCMAFGTQTSLTKL